MITESENHRLTSVTAGTPGGELLRRYWYPIATAGEMRGAWTKRVRLLGEDLVLFRDRSGRLGLIGEFCPHRRASLAYGIPAIDGIRCPYHGWKFDTSGACIEQPNEPAGSTFKEKVTIGGYAVGELGGLIWGYLGPQPAPLIPKLDGFVVEPAIRMVGAALVPCNWLQIMENSCDPVHTEWLHGHLQEFVEEQRDGIKPSFAISRHHVAIAFDEFEYGLYKRRLYEGQSEDADDWKVGHPVFFPNTLAVGSKRDGSRTYSFQIRVPVDDTTTMHYWYNAYTVHPGVEIPAHMLDGVAQYEVPFRKADGEFLLELLDAQDVMAWVTQGPIAKRELEKLGTTDRGVILFRKMLEREIDRVAAGQDPMGVIREPARNAVIDLHVEYDKSMNSDGVTSRFARTQARYYPHIEQLVDLIERARVAAQADRQLTTSR
ncbi:MAG TPA: Rieske 2Fe-2S domain-containing protein [Candidatus Lustribacter sp.]